MTRKAWIRIAQAAAILTLIAAGVFVVRFFFISDDDDRPPIIVRSGSIGIDNGDKTASHGTWKKWKADGTRRWKPDHGNGASVTGFDVTVTGATASSTCLTSFSAETVEVDYSQGTTNPAVTVSFVSNSSGKKEPLIESSVNMSIVPETSTDPEKLEYNPGSGFVSEMRGKSAGSTVSTCAFGQSPTPAITIQPRR